MVLLPQPPMVRTWVCATISDFRKRPMVEQFSGVYQAMVKMPGTRSLKKKKQTVIFLPPQFLFKIQIVKSSLAWH